MLVGRFFGADSIGLYSRAAALLNRPLEQFLYPISSVFIPALSRVQTQPERYRRTFLQVYESMALVSFLFTGLLLALSRPLTLVVLGPKWEKAAIIFAAFAVAALVCSGCKSCQLVVHQSRPRRQRLVTCKFAGCGSRNRFFRGWPAIRSGRSRDLLFHCLPFHRSANSLLFRRTGGSGNDGRPLERVFSLPSALDSR